MKNDSIYYYMYLKKKSFPQTLLLLKLGIIYIYYIDVLYVIIK